MLADLVDAAPSSENSLETASDPVNEDDGWQEIFLWWPSRQWCDTRRGIRRAWLMPGRCWRRFSERRQYWLYRR